MGTYHTLSSGVVADPHIVVGWKKNGTVSLSISISSGSLKAKDTHRGLPTMIKGH